MRGPNVSGLSAILAHHAGQAEKPRQEPAFALKWRQELIVSMSMDNSFF
jgi:hypothetical protein